MRSVTLALLLTISLLFAGQAAALNPERALSAYKHSRWTAMEGAPAIIYSLTQDRAGYLIIGTATGLYRFDGLTFEHIPSRDPEISQGGRITQMLNARDGTIWLTYTTGHIATYRDGVLRLDRSVPPTTVEPQSIVQTRNGTIWVSLPGAGPTLLRRQNGKWEKIIPDLDVSDTTHIVDMFVSRTGSLWLLTYRSIYVQHGRQQRFDRVADVFGRTKLSEDRNGRIWATDDRGTRPLLPTDSGEHYFPTPPFHRWTAVTKFDRDGNLWIANGQGLFRVRSPTPGSLKSSAERLDHVEGLTSRDGLTADTATPLFEDREGNIWVGTTRGLDQFRDVSVVDEPALTAGSGRSIGLLAASDGSVYVGAADALYRIAPRGRPQIVAKPLAELRLICEAPGGEIWAMGNDAFVRVRGRAVKRMAVPEPFRKLGPYDLGGCMTDGHGVLWVSRYWTGNADSGLFTLSGGRWRHRRFAPDGWPKAIERTSDGRLVAWLLSGDVGMLDANGKLVRRLARLPLSNDHMLQVMGGKIILGGEAGLVKIQDGKVRTIDPGRFPWLADPTGLVETPAGQSWILGRAGIVGFRTSALDRAFVDRRAPLDATVLDFQDGLPEVRNLVSQHGAVRGGDGRIWFATVGGVVWIDPAKLVRNALPPLVHIRNLTAGSLQYRDPPASIDLTRGTTNIAIRYAGLSLTLPQRVRFRYQLEGVDEQWVDPGTRREAFYTNLGPGTYRFKVMAANNDGIWNRQPAAVQFTIPPTFVQSIWFKLLGGLLLVLFVWAIIRIRTRAMRAGLQARFDARIAEREEIARELHDTLLQSIQGLILGVQLTVERLPSDDGLRQSVEQVLDRADTVLGEGRDRVQALRSDIPPENLPEALARAGAELVPGPEPDFQFLLEGVPRTVRPAVSREILRIAEEALRNAAHHASANKILMRLDYRRQALCLIVSDDGSGIPGAILDAGRRDGHFGLLGMRERAAQIAGQLEIVSADGRGTEVRLSIPGRVAYQGYRARLRDRLGALWSKTRKVTVRS